MIKCPNCGESYFQENYTASTAMYCPPVYLNGVYIETSDNNYHSTYCTCLNCGKNFSYTKHKGETYVPTETKM